MTPRRRLLRSAFEVAATFGGLGGVLFVSAGELRWPMAWALLGVFLAYSVVAVLVVDPALLEERRRVLAGSEPRDVVLSSTFAVLLYPGTLAACGLDHRFGGSPALPAGVEVAALVLFLAGYSFALWAMRVNVFFSAAVRVQKERGHRVVDRGPYRWVRHPGYAGSIAAHLALPFALGSLWGLLPAVAGALLVAVRAVYEEGVLVRELAGYREYTARVPWRLVPGLW